MNIRYFIIAAAVWTINQTALSAQTPLNTRIDERYGNTTVVYKDKNTTDAELLNRLDKEYGMGDVIRITQAPTSVAPSTASPAVKAPQKTQASGSVRPVLQTRLVTASPKTPAQGAALPEAPVVTEKPAAALIASTDRPELFLQNLTRPATVVRADASPARPVVPAGEEAIGKATKVTTSHIPATQTKVVAKQPARATVVKTVVKTTGHKQYYQHKSRKHFSLKKWWANIKPAGKQRYKCYRF